MHTILLASLITTLNLLLFLQPTLSLSFTISNNCPFTIWPGTLAGSGTPQLSTTGFQLDSGKAVKIQSTPGWSGRIWARTGCRFDGSGTGSCQTGGCGGRLECDGNGASPPASLFEITLGKGTDKDFYDVSLVDGYNVPILAWPVGVPGGSSCNATGCVYDVNKGCPKELQVVGGDGLERLGGGGGGGGRQVVACKSACEAFGQDQYCCSGAYANPTTCRPSFYSSVFKKACPRAYSYAFDDSSSTFTCKAYDYVIVFCPAPIRATESDGRAPNPSSPPPPSVPLSPPSVPLSPPSLPLSPPSLPLSPPSLPLSPPPPENNYEAPMGGVFSSSHILQPISQVIFLLGILSLLIF